MKIAATGVCDTDLHAANGDWPSKPTPSFIPGHEGAGVDLLDLGGAPEAGFVQVSGPSGQCVAAKDHGRRIGFEDLPTGGSIMVFGPGRDVLDVADQFSEFFVEEFCG